MQTFFRNNITNATLYTGEILRLLQSTLGYSSCSPAGEHHLSTNIVKVLSLAGCQQPKTRIARVFWFFYLNL